MTVLLPFRFFVASLLRMTVLLPFFVILRERSDRRISALSLRACFSDFPFRFFVASLLRMTMLLPFFVILREHSDRRISVLSLRACFSVFPFRFFVASLLRMTILLSFLAYSEGQNRNYFINRSQSVTISEIFSTSPVYCVKVFLCKTARRMIFEKPVNNYPKNAHCPVHCKALRFGHLRGFCTISPPTTVYYYNLSYPF